MRLSLKRFFRAKFQAETPADDAGNEQPIADSEVDEPEIKSNDDALATSGPAFRQEQQAGLSELEELIESEAEAPVREGANGLVDNQEETPEYLTDSSEGQLAVDVYQHPNEIIIKSTIAGVRPEDLDVSINNDMVTIKGTRRQEEEVKEDDYFLKECYWGAFSRSIILPVEVKQEKIEATIKDGVLTVRLPKLGKARAKVIKVKSDE